MEVGIVWRVIENLSYVMANFLPLSAKTEHTLPLRPSNLHAVTTRTPIDQFKECLNMPKTHTNLYTKRRKISEDKARPEI